MGVREVKTPAAKRFGQCSLRTMAGRGSLWHARSPAGGWAPSPLLSVCGCPLGCGAGWPAPHATYCVTDL